MWDEMPSNAPNVGNTQRCSLFNVQRSMFNVQSGEGVGTFIVYLAMICQIDIVPRLVLCNPNGGKLLTRHDSCQKV